MVSDTPERVEGLQQPVQQRALDGGVRTGMWANAVLALTCDYD
jgi:hypothetical protein